MSIPERKRQGGAALIALAAIIVLGISWMLLSRLSAANRVAADQGHNARVLAEAKAALLGWVATNTLDSAENNPGRLPCPQAWADIGDTTNEGRAAANCSVPAAGWLPWRTLGLPKLLDASGQQLWYVVSPGWHLPSAGATLTLNSNTAGQLTLDGAPMVALIIAPGPALNLAPNANQLAAGCAARSQSQALSLPATPPNPLDFLECQNGTTADGTFAASVIDNGANRVFNDQVVGVTAGDVLPGMEAAISKRIERDIVPALKLVYAPPSWGIPGANPVYPFPAPFANPGTSSFGGAAGTYAGLLPFNYSENCAPPADPRCAPPFVVWDQPSGATLQRTGGSATLQSSPPASCSFPTATTVQCVGEYDSDGTLELRLTARANVAMALRKLDAAAAQATVEERVSGTWVAFIPTTKSATGTLNSNGSGTIGIDTVLPNRSGGTDFRITADIAILTDHPLLKADSATTGWFVRNEWYRLTYYAVAQGHTATALPSERACITATDCLSVTSVAPAGAQRAILILAGRSINGSARPSGTLGDYLEFGNATGSFERRAVNTAVNGPFNDRVVVVDANP